MDLVQAAQGIGQVGQGWCNELQQRFRVVGGDLLMGQRGAQGFRVQGLLRQASLTGDTQAFAPMPAMLWRAFAMSRPGGNQRSSPKLDSTAAVSPLLWGWRRCPQGEVKTGVIAWFLVDLTRFEKAYFTPWSRYKRSKNSDAVIAAPKLAQIEGGEL